jgi:DNA-binding CsgD family transcriptional regulator
MAHQAAYAQQDGVGLDEGCDRTLTLREGQIARLVAIGSTDKEIARELDISPLTVATHLRHIYRKFDVHKRGAMVAMLMRVGQLMILLGSTLNVGDEDLQALVQSVIGPAIASIS